MSALTARQLRAALSNAAAVCSALGLVAARGASAYRCLVLCPAHLESNPSCSIRQRSDGTLSVRCFACGWSDDVLGLIARARGIDSATDFRGVLAAAAEIAGLPATRETWAPTRVGADARDETFDRVWRFVLDACNPMPRHVSRYLDRRGILAVAGEIRGVPSDPRLLSKALGANFDRADLEAADLVWRGGLQWLEYPLIIPWRDRHGFIRGVQRRRIDDVQPHAYRWTRGHGPRAPFGVDALRASLGDRDASALIVEGALDVLAARRLATSALAILGIASASSPMIGMPLDLIRGRRVLVGTDADDAGDRASATLVEALRGVAASVERVRPPKKDWGETLLAKAVRR